MLRWMATIRPGYREHVGSRRAASGIAANVDWWSAAWGNRAFLEPFIDPVTMIGPHARALVGIALGAKEAGERGLATDVVRLALADGRLTASDVAEGLTAAAAVACDRPIRWAISLADVASHSAGHAIAVAAAIARSLAAIADRPPGKLVPLLRLLDEILAGSDTPVMAEGRPALEHFAERQRTGRTPRAFDPLPRLSQPDPTGAGAAAPSCASTCRDWTTRGASGASGRQLHPQAVRVR